MKLKFIVIFVIIFFIVSGIFSTDVFAREQLSQFGISLNPFILLTRYASLGFQFYPAANSAWSVEFALDFTSFGESDLASLMLYGGYTFYFSDQKGFFLQGLAGAGFDASDVSNDSIITLLFLAGYRFRWNRFYIEPKILIGGAYSNSQYVLKYGWRMNIGILF